MFHPISKHLEFRQKYSATRRIFNSLLGVWKSDETLSRVFDILRESFEASDSIFMFLFSQLSVHRFLPFGIMAGLALAAATVCMTLPETHNRPTMEDLSHDKKNRGEEKDESKNEKSGEEEETTLM